MDTMNLFDDNEQHTTKPNKQYQDSVFIDLFSEPDNSVELINALCGTTYKTDDITNVTLKWVFANGKYNDLAFRTKDNKLIVLIEHQSTFNPNMPLRILFYLAKEYEDYLVREYGTGKNHLYSKKLIKLPTPEFFIIYTGKDERPAIEELHLSDAFYEKADINLTVKSYNLNKPLKLKEESEILNGYANLIIKIKELKEEGRDHVSSIREAIEYCIENNYIKKYLKVKKKEVYEMLYGEISVKAEMEVRCKEEREAGREEGLEEGLEKGREEGLEKGREEIVLSMYKKGLEIETISDLSSIPLEDVRRICNVVQHF